MLSRTTPLLLRLLNRRSVILLAVLVLLGALAGGAAWAPSASAQVPIPPYPWMYYGNGYTGYPTYGYGSPVTGCALGCVSGNGYPSPNFPYNALGSNQEYPTGAYNPYYYNYYGYGYPVGYSYNQGVQFTNTPATGPVTPTAPVQPPAYNLSGQYCADSSGGLQWVATGGPTEGLTCGTNPPSSTGTPSSTSP